MQLLHAAGALLDGQDQDGRTALHQVNNLFTAIPPFEMLMAVTSKGGLLVKECQPFERIPALNPILLPTLLIAVPCAGHPVQSRG